jgi:hypothetical protein
MNFNARRVALTGGIVWGMAMFLTTLASIYTGYGTAFLNVMASIYPGYRISLPGSIVGAYSADSATGFRRKSPPDSVSKRQGVPIDSATPGRSVATLVFSSFS